MRRARAETGTAELRRARPRRLAPRRARSQPAGAAGLVGLVVGVLGGSGLGGCGPADDGGPFEEVRTLESSEVVCADGETIEGIDVSYYQGTVDWAAVAASGRGFAITRINHGTFLDPEFETNWAGIRDAGMIRGSYQFFEPGDDVAQQAAIAIEKVGVLGPGDLPVTLDVESTSGVGPQAVADAVGEWLDLVEAGTGKRPFIYTGKYFWNDNVQSDAYADVPLWIAAYGPPCPDTPTAWDDWMFWQYSSTGSVPGIAGNVDLDVFKGGAEELAAFSGLVFGARWVEDTVPAIMEAGTEARVAITIENIGGYDLTDATWLVTAEPRDRESAFAASDWESSSVPAAVGEVVAPGQTYTFELTLLAPSEPGTYLEHFALFDQQGGWFGDAPNLGPLDDALAFEIEVIEPDAAGGAGGAGGGGGAGASPDRSGDPDEDDGCAVSGGAGRPGSGTTGALLGVGLFVLWRRRRPR
jgi:lysozyme